MRGLLPLLTLVLAVPSVAAQDVSALLGRRVTDVRLDAGGTAVADRTVVDLIETRLGEPLAMTDVRQTIDHLVALGRFVDVRVFAEPDDADGVRLRYALVPVAQVGAIQFQGLVALDERALRSDLADRFGARPGAARLPAMAATVVDRYRAAGYAAATVEVRTRPLGGQGDVVANFVVTPGRPTLIRRATIEGPEAATRGVLDRLGLAPGRPLPGEALDRRVDAVEEALRAQGFYEAVVSATVTPVPADAADVAVMVSPGDPVDLVFTGDPLSDDRRRALVPVARLQSVEEEVLEDASRNIEQALRLDGYRSATAQPSRQRANGRLRITFDVQRGPLHVLGRVAIDGARAMPAADLQSLVSSRRARPTSTPASRRWPRRWPSSTVCAGSPLPASRPASPSPTTAPTRRGCRSTSASSSARARGPS
jgi:outer membrane protein assembly factor BamA